VCASMHAQVAFDLKSLMYLLLCPGLKLFFMMDVSKRERP
jgi:hypothetical protein